MLRSTDYRWVFQNRNVSKKWNQLHLWCIPTLICIPVLECKKRCKKIYLQTEICIFPFLRKKYVFVSRNSNNKSIMIWIAQKVIKCIINWRKLLHNHSGVASKLLLFTLLQKWLRRKKLCLCVVKRQKKCDLYRKLPIK